MLSYCETIKVYANEEYMSICQKKILF